MQGRLLPKLNGRYQAHPVGYWNTEFAIANGLELDCIEFIFDLNDYQNNPLYSDNGLKKIQKMSSVYGVKVSSICADYFMEAPLHHSQKEIATNSSIVLKKLIESAQILKVSDIVIPCVDKSSLKNPDDKKRLIESLLSLVSEAEKHSVNICLETDLDPSAFYKLLENFKSERITVNYDIGNSASLGYDIKDEFEAYGDRISDIHIKDRKFNGPSVILGEGSADFDTFFDLLKHHSYVGPLILQAYRDDEGLKVFESQFNWFKSFFEPK